MNFKILMLIFAIFLTTLSAKEFKVDSPNKKFEVKIIVDKNVSYSISKSGYKILLPSQISLTLNDERVLGVNPKLIDENKRTVDEVLRPVVKQKFEKIRDNYNELVLTFEGNYSLIFRVYDDGVAYRFSTGFDENIIIKSEQVEFNFDKDYDILFPEEESFISHSERIYQSIKLSEVTGKRFCSLPALVKLDNNRKVVITEADLEDYCGLYLTRNQNKQNSFTGLFPQFPSKDTVRNDRDVYVTERKDYLAETKGSRNFPWRVIVVSEKDGDLIESTMIYKLAKPADPKTDFSWIKPGKVAWDWWNFNNIYGVDFKAGVNTETYKYYIDFASKFGIEYIILDEGWYKLGNLLDVNPDIDVEEIINYGKQKNVDVILWVIWKTLDDQLKEALDQFVIWGAAGIKVDFMQRDDQPMVQYY